MVEDSLPEGPSIQYKAQSLLVQYSSGTSTTVQSGNLISGIWANQPEINQKLPPQITVIR
jgi:hypothetical protein